MILLHQRKLIAILFLLLILPLTALAQKRSVKILGLSVEGNKTVDASMIRLSSGLNVGSEVTGDGIQEAIKQLWRLSLFSDIQILVDRELADGAYLVIHVVEYPRLEKVEIEGNKKLKKDDVETILNLYPGQVVSPTLISRAKSKLYDKYKEKGYLLAKIKANQYISRDDSNRVLVRFVFEEGNKVQIEKINFHGNDHFSDGKLRKQMKKTKEDRWWRGADFDREKYAEDQGKLLDFYFNHGYRDAEILRDSLYYSPDRSDMFVDIWLHEGEQYTFGNITWKGNTVFSVEQLTASLGFSTGETYSKKKLDEALSQRIGTLYYDRGYIYAQVEPTEVPGENNVLNLDFTVSEGKQAKVNEIHITGNTRTKEKVIRRELKILPGDTFSRTLLERSQREVWMLNYFGNVEPKVNPIDEEKVDLEFKVEEKSTDTAGMSAGYSESDKFIGSLNLAMANLFGNGQRMSFDWNFGRFYRSFNLSFAEPWLRDTPTLAGISFYDTKRDAYYYGYKQASQGFSLRLGRDLSWPDNFFRSDWIYGLDETTLSDFNSYYVAANPNGIVTQDWPLISSSVTHILTRNSLDRPEFPTAGSEVTLTNELSGSFLGGNVDFHKHTFRMDWFMPAYWKFVLYSSFQAGYMETLGKGGNILYTEYFFMGGDGLSRSIPLRGYEDPLGESTSYAAAGGKSYLKYTAELRIPIAPNPTIFALFFAEAGKVWSNFHHADPFTMKRSVGVGGRVYMPMIGIIGFDYGYGFDRVDASGNPDPKWKMHFVFGRSF
jgi:outer membrane protein insertion porin family